MQSNKTPAPRPRYAAFGYSLACNSACAHCVARQDADSAATMDIEAAEALVGELGQAAVRGLSFTAGEPLLFSAEINRLVKRCRADDMFSRVVTNAFWASSSNSADTVVRQLQKSGLCQLRISCSRWHGEFISPGNTLTAARSCRRLGLDYFVSFITDFSQEDDELEARLRSNGLKYFPEPLLYYGGAANFTRPPVCHDFQRLRCRLSPYITPELDFYACCDAGTHFHKTGFFHVGSRTKHSMADLYTKLEEHPLYRLIEQTGLSALASSIGMPASEI
ncbi:MAG: radical SAM protein, partial [Deltaproteobacteria bacterium]|nr:radical SAM protein [Deltaproteobacteria bacterium]